ncbi:MAG: sigma-70 family RNA polymerase sigma factor [Sedimentisphaerales bacterium]|nr:sigma-70 family RNA polymerase sigma factor [Sedimentisphaerales bacterium]
MAMDRREFVELLTQNYCRVNSFIFCMVPNEVDSEEIMQETTVLMWEKFDQYKSGTNFVAWALTIAKYKILSYQRDKQRNHIQLEDQVAEMVETASKAKLTNDNTVVKVAALKKCIQKLPQKDRKIIQLKYSNGLSNKTLADNEGVSLPTIYRHLSRIYLILLNCINHSLSIEEL